MAKANRRVLVRGVQLVLAGMLDDAASLLSDHEAGFLRSLFCWNNMNRSKNPYGRTNMNGPINLYRRTSLDNIDNAYSLNGRDNATEQNSWVNGRNGLT